jgi:hypothetical protein
MMIRQYSGQNWNTVSRTLTLLDSAGNTIIPNQLTVNNRNILTELDNTSLTNHTHSTTQITEGVLPIIRGGTGADNPKRALANMGLRKISFNTIMLMRELHYYSVLKLEVYHWFLTYMPIEK